MNNNWTLCNNAPINGGEYFISIRDDSGDIPVDYVVIATCFHINKGEYLWVKHDEPVYGTVYAWQPVIYPKPAPYERR